MCLPHLEPTSIKSAKGFAKFCPISYHQNFKKRFSHFLVLFFEFFFASVIPKNQGVKNRGKKGRKTTKFFWGVFWIQFVIFFVFTTSGTYLNQNGGRFTKPRQKWQKCHFLKGILLPRLFQTKKKVFFTTKIWMFIFFFLFMESKPYLQGVSQSTRSFEKKNYFLVFLNQSHKYGDFCENSHFFKNDGQNWGVRRGRNFCTMTKFFYFF